MPTNEQFEITNIKTKLNNAGNAERLHECLGSWRGGGEWDSKLLKMVREDFIKKAELHLKGKSRSGQSRK